MKKLPVCETFCSLQGEGIHTGIPSFFIRFSGCNLHCIWCDTPYASRPDIPPAMMSTEMLLTAVREYPAISHVVITGGEPLLQKGLADLTEKLAGEKRHVTIETNGTRPPDGICCALASISPKLPGTQPDGGDAIDLECLESWCRNYVCQLKFVVESDADITAVQALLSRLTKPPPRENIFLMPRAKTEAEQHALVPWLVSVCRETGMRYGHRLQLTLFGNKRGT